MAGSMVQPTGCFVEGNRVRMNVASLPQGIYFVKVLVQYQMNIIQQNVNHVNKDMELIKKEHVVKFVNQDIIHQKKEVVV